MRTIALSLVFCLPLAAAAWDFQGDETRKPELQRAVDVLEFFGFPAPDAVRLDDNALALTLQGQTLGAPLKGANVDLAWALLDLELAVVDRNAFRPWRDATAAFLRSRVHKTDWIPSSLQEGMLKAWMTDLTRERPEFLGSLWSAVRESGWRGWKTFFQFNAGTTPEDSFAASASRVLPSLRPLIPRLPAVDLKEGQITFALPPAPPLSVSMVELAFPADRVTGTSIAWDAPRFPVPAVLLAYYGPPLDTFDVVDLSRKQNEILVPFKGLSALYIAGFSPDFSTVGDPLALHAAPEENYPFVLKQAALKQDEEGISVTFDTEALRRIDGFVLMKGMAGDSARPQPVGMVPGLGSSGDAYSFTILDPASPDEGQRPVYYLYAITEDGLLAQAAELPLAASQPVAAGTAAELH